MSPSTPTIVTNGDRPSSVKVETDLLIVGAGPAGASLACFLASHGLRGIVIAASAGTSSTPRAHITNMAALECLRDIGLEEECMRVATKGDCMTHTRWCYSMAGEEYARIHSWGNDPDRKGDYARASPCKHVDLPQTLLEPILNTYAAANGFSCRFETRFISFEEEESGTILTTVQDTLNNHTYCIRSKYLFGADGGRSPIMRQLDIPLIKKPGQGLAINVLVETDLSVLVQHRMGNLHYMMQPDVDFPDFGWVAIARMVKPWHEWMFIFLQKPGTSLDTEPSEEEYLKRVKEFIGDDSIPAKVLGVSKWYINEIVAEHYSRGNIFCLGDAVHRHPPLNGLGSNTCIQDAFNLAWKVAYIMKGKAGKALLRTYSEERQPVGKSVITRANEALRDHIPIWEATGVMEPTLAQRKEAFAELKHNTPAGAARRAKLVAGVQGTAHEFHGLGIEMNQRYASSAIHLKDEGLRPALPDDPVLEHQISTYPGSRLPHAWLNTGVPSKPLSTIDLAGKGGFTLFTGYGGERWKQAAEAVSNQLEIPIRAYAIGYRLDWEDVYFRWATVREVEDSGCVVVRPDRFVCWRSKSMVADPDATLKRVLKAVLSRQ